MRHRRAGEADLLGRPGRRESPARRLAAATVALGVIALVVAAALQRSVWLVLLAGLVSVLLISWLRSPPLDLVLDVGEQERHRVRVHVDTFWGRLWVSVDGHRARDVHRSTVQLTTVYRLAVGEAEEHELRVERDMNRTGRRGRPQQVRVYVDETLSTQSYA